MSNTADRIPTPIIDKNGKATTVHKNPDKTNAVGAARVDSVKFTAIAGTYSTSDFHGVNLGKGKVEVTSKDGRAISMTIPEAGAVTNAITSMIYERATNPGTENHQPISNDILVGYKGNNVIITGKSVGEISLEETESQEFVKAVEAHVESERNLGFWNKTTGLVNVIESPVSDRESNYNISLGNDAMIYMYIGDSGLAGDSLGTGERDNVTFYRDGDQVKVQIGIGDHESHEELENLDDVELESLVADINNKLSKIDPRYVANFDDPVMPELLYNSTVSHQIDSNGSYSFYTSNALATVEDEMMENSNEAWSVFVKGIDTSSS